MNALYLWLLPVKKIRMKGKENPFSSENGARCFLEVFVLDPHAPPENKVRETPWIHPESLNTNEGLNFPMFRFSQNKKTEWHWVITVYRSEVIIYKSEIII